jgi:hypothetical protein
MTRRANARLAGVAYLLYIAVAFPEMLLSGAAQAGASAPARLANIGLHASDMRLTIVLALLSSFSALVLAVTLRAITRHVDEDLATMAMLCRVAEGIVSGAFIATVPGLVWLATTTGPQAADPIAAQSIAAFFIRVSSWQVQIGAMFFAVGSTIFCWLLLRGRVIPRWLAWLGLIGSALVAVMLPLQLLQVLTGSLPQFGWLPIAAFEILVSVWFLWKAVPEVPASQSSAAVRPTGR